MTTSDKLTAIRRACIAAVENIKIPEDHLSLFIRDYRSIRLADVLLAIEHLGKTGGMPLVYADGEINARGKISFWNLRNDDLTDQSPECIDFLFELLSNPQP